MTKPIVGYSIYVPRSLALERGCTQPECPCNGQCTKQFPYLFDEHSKPVKSIVP